MNDFAGALSRGIAAGAGYRLGRDLHIPAGAAGNLLGRTAGSSLEFMDHREYQPGDDLRRIDWNAFARTDKLILKLYREEINPHVDILLDCSKSMDLPDSQKAHAAVALASAVATAAANSGYTASVFCANEMCMPAPNGSAIPAAWGAWEFDAVANLAAALDRQPPRWARRGIRVIISDLLFEVQPESILQRISQNASAVLILQLLGRDDVNPPRKGHLRLIDSETGMHREIFIDDVLIRQHQRMMEMHRQSWSDAARKCSARLATLTAEDFVENNNDLSPLVAARIMEPN